MFKNIKQVIPWISFAAMAVAALLLIATSTKRTSLLVESPETAATAEKVLNTITATTPLSLDDQSLISSLEQASDTPYIAQVWLFAPDGQVKFVRGTTPLNAESASQLATRQVKGALAALPKGTLDQQQQMLLLVGSAIQAEGEHNDIYRYRVRVLTSPENEVVGYVGITYDVSVAVSAMPGLWEIVSTVGLLLGFVVYWVGLAVWTYLDAKEHQERAFVWALFVLIGNLVALIAYLLVRTPAGKAGNQASIY
jgi:hypothetical protein